MIHDDDDRDDSAAKMSFLEHLDELRKRIIYSALSIGVGFLIAFIFVQQLFDFVMRPMQRLLPAGQTLIYTDPSEAFLLQIKLALITGLIIASPIVFAQVWLFIAPGLYSHEKRWAIPFVVMAEGPTDPLPGTPERITPMRLVLSDFTRSAIASFKGR